jgi:hypothetical protein
MAQQAPSGAETSGASTQDMKLEKKIDQRLQHDQKLKARNVDASVSDGMVTLTGTVRTQSEKARAEHLAHTKGVNGVDNQIQIEGQEQTQEGTTTPAGERGTAPHEGQPQPSSEGNVRERSTHVEERSETRTERVPQPSQEQQQEGTPSSAPSDENVPRPASPTPPSAPAPAPHPSVPQE